jgi:uncharacterized protein YbaR (Trm112 family)
MSEIKSCKKCGAPLDLVRPACILLPCPQCKTSLEIRFSPEGGILLEAAGASSPSLSSRPRGVHISQLDLFFHWEKVEKSVAQSLDAPILGRCPLCKGNVYLEKASSVVMECEYCGGKTPVQAEELTLSKKEESLSFPSSLLSFGKRIARHLNIEDRKRLILKYLHLYRWLLVSVVAVAFLLFWIILRRLLSHA